MCGRLFKLLDKNRDSVKTAEDETPTVTTGSKPGGTGSPVVNDRYRVHVPGGIPDIDNV